MTIELFSEPTSFFTWTSHAVMPRAFIKEGNEVGFDFMLLVYALLTDSTFPVVVRMHKRSLMLCLMPAVSLIWG